MATVGVWVSIDEGSSDTETYQGRRRRVQIGICAGYGGDSSSGQRAQC